MPDVTEGLRGAGPAPGQRQTVKGYVSKAKPAPASFTDPLYVVLPDFSADYSEPVRWAPIHGTALPQPGADVLVVYDQGQLPHAVWWDGTANFPSNGPWRNVGDPAQPAFQNSWVNRGSVFDQAQFRLLADAQHVELRGAVMNGTNNATAFNLPAGFRPPHDVIFVCTGFASADTFTRVRVTSGGDVELFMAATPTAEAHIGPSCFSTV